MATENDLNDYDLQYETHLQRRHQLITYFAYYCGACMVALMAMRLSRVSIFALSIAMGLALIIGVTVGLLLLSRFIQNETQLRTLRKAIESVQKAKRRPIAHFVVGDDGELVETESEEKIRHR
jgi:low affinity Fe/Cu permease